MPGPTPDVAFFEPLVKAATRVVVSEGESRTVDLRVFTDAGK